MNSMDNLSSFRLWQRSVFYFSFVDGLLIYFELTFAGNTSIELGVIIESQERTKSHG